MKMERESIKVQGNKKKMKMRWEYEINDSSM